MATPRPLSRISLILSLLLPLTASARADDAVLANSHRIPIAMAYADDAVNTSIFRVSALLSAGDDQFACFYAPDGTVVLARRSLARGPWDIAPQPFKGHVGDAHNDVVLGISSDGLLHLSYDHHGSKLHYRVSARPFDIHSFSDLRSMAGQDEDHVTYPQFITAPSGNLYFFYRDGASGNGTLCLNRYEPASKTWSVIHHPLVDGEGKCNPYWWRPCISTDGTIYLAWCWRDSPNAQTNHDLCFALSRDGGKSWLRSDGMPQPLPITRENAQVIDPIPMNSNLINQCSSAVDAAGHCHLVQYFNDHSGIPQYFDEWFDGAAWHKSQVSHRTARFSISGGGSLAIPISRPEIALKADGTACVITRDAEAGGGIRLYESSAPYDQWKIIDVTREDLGNWEPTYDLNRFARSQILSLFVLPVRQGNHEHTTGFGPHEAAVIETSLK